eukprot:scaffold29862_cov51-Phaeocystis_antarctica.AAC.2
MAYSWTAARTRAIAAAVAAGKSPLERRQRAAFERNDQGGAAGVGDLRFAEVEPNELRQHSSRRRLRTCRQVRLRTCRRRRRRHEGGDTLVAERAVPEKEILQRRKSPQGRREGHQPRVADGVAAQREDIEPRQGASAQGGGEHRGACVAYMHTAESEEGQGRQRARAQPRRQPLHAVGAMHIGVTGCVFTGWVFDDEQRLERWQHRA